MQAMQSGQTGAATKTRPAPLFTNRQLIRLLWPLVIEQGLAVLVGMADTVMVSSAGEAAISGVSLVDMVNQLIFNIFAALATGGAVVTSQALGANDPDRAHDSAGQLVSLAAVLGAGVMAAALAFRAPLLRLLFGTVTDDVMAAALLYFFITALSYPFLALYNAGAAIFRSVGNSAVSMRVSVLVNLINVAGNALCIYALHMGVAGVAVPTFVSRAVGAVVILSLAAREDSQPLRLSRATVFQWRRPMVRDILHIGIPSALENSIFQLGRVLVVSMISLHGTVHITANAVANNLDSVGCIVGNAAGLAMITVVGRCVGAGDMGAATRYTKKLVGWDYLAQGLVQAVVIATLPWTLALYTLSAETFRLAWLLVVIHAGCAIVLWPAAFVLPNALRAANDVQYTMVTSIASMMVWRLGFSYILCVRMGWGAVGVWVAMVVDWVCRVACFVGRFASHKWEEHAKRKGETARA